MPIRRARRSYKRRRIGPELAIARIVAADNAATKRVTALQEAAARLAGYQHAERQRDYMARLPAQTTRAQSIADRRYGKYTGQGSYSIGRNWRKSGLGKTIASSGRQLIRAGTTAAIGKLAGMGLYEGSGSYQDNQLIQGSSYFPVGGAFANDETGSVTYSARQFVRIVNAPGTSGFSKVQIAINPGLEESFPWLSGTAMNFEEYAFSQLVFEFQNTLEIGGLNTEGQTGTMCMLCDYNNNDETFDSVEQMIQYHGSVAGKITDDLRMGVECDPGKGRNGTRFVRTKPVKIGGDIEEYDAGELVLGFSNVPSNLQNKQIGYLWVFYTVTLSKPKLQRMRGEDVKMCVWGATTSLTQDALLGGATQLVLLKGQQNTFECDIVDNAEVITVTLPTWLNGDFSIKLRTEGTVLGGTVPTWGLAGNVAAIANIYASGSSTDSPNPTHKYIDVGATHMMTEMHFRVRPAVAGTNNQLTLAYNAFTATTITQTILELVEINTCHAINPATNNFRTRFVEYLDPSSISDI